MVSAPPALTFTSLGFWFPVGRSNFFDSQQDEPLVASYNGQSTSRTGPLEGYRLLEDVPSFLPRLQSSVYSRLCSVLPAYTRWQKSSPQPDTPSSITLHEGKCYDTILPVYPRARIGYHNDTDPIGIIATCRDFNAPEWETVATAMKSLTLFVSVDGFYIWFALHDSRTEASKVEGALSKHITLLVGGDFFSHYAKRKDQHDLVSPHEERKSLLEYRQYNLGILNFFQINTIFEGMYNYNFDPRIFFDPSSSMQNTNATPTQIDRYKEEYALGTFMEHLVTMPRFVRSDHPYDHTLPSTAGPTTKRPAAPSEQAVEEQVTEEQVRSRLLSQLTELHDLEHARTGIDWLYFLSDFGRLALNSVVRRDLLRQFLRKTSIITMQMMKWRIESCRRSLLITMVQLPSRRQPLVQTEVPDPNPDEQSRTRQRQYLILNVNESQLRDYITLLSAKIPLILNVEEYLDIALNSIGKPVNEDPVEEPGQQQGFKAAREESLRESIYTIEHTWRAQLHGIEANIKALENAMEQVYMAQMLTETEKLRAEQETLAEIERIRDRTGNGLSTLNANTVDVISNIITIVSSLVAIILVYPNVGSIFTYLEDIAARGIVSVVLALGVLLGSIVALILFYAGLHLLIENLTLSVQKLVSGRRRARNEQFYYEMDVRLDAEITSEKAWQLVEGTFDDDAILHSLQHSKPGMVRLALGRARPQRSSYRVDRSNADESMHKIYLDALVYWPRRFMAHSVLFARRRMRVFLVYEVYFHRPSGIPTYILRDLRLVSTSPHKLDKETIRQLKYLAAEQFINCWIDPQHQERTIRLSKADTTSNEDRFDALFALTEKEGVFGGFSSPTASALPEQTPAMVRRSRR